MNGFNQYICEYCHNPCRRESKKHRGNAKYLGNKVRWQSCDTCQVHYAVHPTGQVRQKKINIPDPKGNGSLYQFEIDYRNNCSRVVYLERDRRIYRTRIFQYVHKVLLEFDHTVNDISPSNIEQKIKTYLLFS